MTNRKPNWIKACEDTQKKLERYWSGIIDSWGEEECSFCVEFIKAFGSGNRTCRSYCPGAEGCRKRYKYSVHSPQNVTPLILAHWLWLEDLKGMLRRGEI
jgi:hypothetical protein